MKVLKGLTLYTCFVPKFCSPKREGALFQTNGHTLISLGNKRCHNFTVIETEDFFFLSLSTKWQQKGTGWNQDNNLTGHLSSQSIIYSSYVMCRQLLAPEHFVPLVRVRFG
jgi:hypothetical protein